jgi:hypothetical protein
VGRPVVASMAAKLFLVAHPQKVKLPATYIILLEIAIEVATPPIVGFQEVGSQ